MDDKKRICCQDKGQEQSESSGVCSPPDQNVKPVKFQDLEINLLNTQGLTQPKLFEIEDAINNRDNLSITCLTETQLKSNSLHFNNNFLSLSKHRSSIEKKGGGLMILWKNNGGLTITEIETDHSDILMAQIKAGKFKFYIILVYISTNDDCRNNIIYKLLTDLTMKFQNENLLIIGDFNGHIGCLGPQPINKNGRKMLNFVDNSQLNILNLDIRCSGEITWKQGNKRSCIDFLLLNEKMYENFTSMTIDEEGEILNFSDHNVLRANFRYQNSTIPSTQQKIIYYNKKDDNSITNYINFLENLLMEKEPANFTEFYQCVKEARDSTLRTCFVQKPIKNLQEPWITDDIKSEIAKKRNINKLRRKEANVARLKELD